MCLSSLANSKNTVKGGRECRYSKCSDYFIPKVKHWKFSFSWLGSFSFKRTLLCIIFATHTPCCQQTENFLPSPFSSIHFYYIHPYSDLHIVLVCLYFYGNHRKTQEVKQEAGKMERFCLLLVLGAVLLTWPGYQLLLHTLSCLLWPPYILWTEFWPFVRLCLLELIQASTAHGF